MPNWLNDAVFYEIYPQSFCDTNGDGIGDIEGIISKLDYVKSLGCNAIWLNPIYDSPFMDAGYDVRNYKKVAERYGTNDDLVRLLTRLTKRASRFFLTLFRVTHQTSTNGSWRPRKPQRANIQTVTSLQRAYGTHRRSTV